MDLRLLDHYNNELQHIRQMAGEFAREFPKIAGRLALEKDGKEICPDPFVERLLEGFAFIAARIHLKLDAEFPRLTQSLLETVYPHYLSPIPAMAVVRFEPDPQEAGLADGYLIPRGTPLRSTIGRGERTPCEFQTAHQLRLWPLRLVEARYYTRDLAELNLTPPRPVKAALRLRLQTTAGLTFKEINLDALTVYIRGADELPVAIYEQIFSRGAGVAVQFPQDRSRRGVYRPPSAVQRVGFSEQEALLPASPRSFEGYRLLREYFSFPQRFLFFTVTDLKMAIQSCAGNQVDIIILLNEQEPRLEGRVNQTCFELFCAPAINLFAKRTDRISLSDRFSEFQVIVDRTRPLDFEVFEIQSVTGYGTRSDEEQEFRPFYLARDIDTTTGTFYTVNRVPRMLTTKERKFGQHSSYSGTEVYLSLVDAASAPYRTDLRELGIKALCTNRHLPIQMALGLGPSDFSIDLNAPVISTRCLSGPTIPQPSPAEGELSWRIISHLSLNYLSLLEARGEEGAIGLRELLKLYIDNNDIQKRKQIEGLLSANSVPIVRRVANPGLVAFARGLEITVLLDEMGFVGTGVFLLGAVLEQFFAKYVSINSFTETVIKSQQRGVIMRWPAQVGRRSII